MITGGQLHLTDEDRGMTQNQTLAVSSESSGVSAALEVHELVKQYGQFTAVKGISFSVQRGEIFGLLGPNGAGKTSTIEIIEGLRTPTSGEVIVLGRRITADPRGVKRLIGAQLQASDFFEHLTLIEQLDYLAACYDMRCDAQALLELVDLGERPKLRVQQLSGGQQQRFAIAAALVNDPPLVLLDEPSTGLDPGARKDLWALIRRMRGEGRTILLSTHYMEEAEELCDRVAIMDRGDIRALEAPAQLIQALLATGYRKPSPPREATLEDVFLTTTGHGFTEAEEAQA
jgi:ABC-2 type transport system ATP-binding protein